MTPEGPGPVLPGEGAQNPLQLPEKCKLYIYVQCLVVCSLILSEFKHISETVIRE